ncbi:hypothetical protein BKA63DRAFT_600848 [Paraphoma chrysanthemicola]|nr:hypothetical protein BKA63DRAFT_600848 [Paraphoma chrysanthemicola]
MENRKSTFGKSASMPLLHQDSQQSPQQENQPVYSDQYQSLQQSPHFQSYRNSPNAQIWSPPASGFLSPGSRWSSNINGYGSNSASFPIGSAAIQGPRPTSSDSGATAMPGQMDHLAQTVSTSSFSNTNDANAVPGQSTAPTPDGIHAPRPLPRRYTVEELMALYTYSSSNDCRSSLLNCGLAKPVGDQSMNNGDGLFHFTEKSTGQPGSKTPNKSWLPGLGHPSLSVEKGMPRKDIYVPGGFAHHRRTSSRVSSVPAIPSPLGPRHYVNDLSSDISGLVSPQPASAPIAKPRHMLRAEKKGDQKNDESDSDSDGIQLIGLDIPVRLTSDPDSKWFDPSISVYGRARKISDPFREVANTFDDSPTPSPSMSKVLRMPIPAAKANTNVRQSSLAQPTGEWVTREQYARTPAQEFGPYSPHAETPSPQNPDFRSTESTTPMTSTFETFTQANDRVDLPIPPPPLPAVQGHLFHDPATRARLDAQAEIRAKWIKTEAKKIAELGRLSFVAAQQYQQTGTQKDFDIWQKFTKAYEDATNLGKRQEERRNMFMPQGMKAMRTGEHNLPGDQSASFTNGNATGDGSTQGQGELLGWKMAYMERVCAEVKRRADEKEEIKEGGGRDSDDEITPELLNTLNKEERKDLRKHLVARLQKAAAEKRFL